MISIYIFINILGYILGENENVCLDIFLTIFILNKRLERL